MEPQKILDTQSNLEKEEQSWRHHTLWSQTMLQKYSNQNSMVLTQRHTHRSMVQNRKPRNKPMLLWSISTEEARIYKGGKTAFLINDVGKTGQLYAKKKKLDHFLTPCTKLNGLRT